MEFPLNIYSSENTLVSSSSLQDEIKTLFESEKIKNLMFSETLEKNDFETKLNLYHDLYKKMSQFFNHQNRPEIEMFLKDLFEYFQDKKDQESLLLYGVIIASSISNISNYCEDIYEFDLLKEFIKTIKNKTKLHSLYYPEIIIQILTSLKYFIPDELACKLMESLLLLLSSETNKSCRVLLSIYKLAKYNNTVLHNYKTKLIDLILSVERLESVESLIPLKFIKVIITNAYCEIEDKIKISLKTWSKYISELLSSNINQQDIEELIQPLKHIRDICSMVSIELQNEILNFLFDHFYTSQGTDIEKTPVFNYKEISNPITDIMVNIISKKSVIIRDEMLNNIKLSLKCLLSDDGLCKSNVLSYWTVSILRAFVVSEREINNIITHDKLTQMLAYSVKNKDADLADACCQLLTQCLDIIELNLKSLGTIIADIFISLEKDLLGNGKQDTSILHIFTAVSRILLQKLESDKDDVKDTLETVLFTPLLELITSLCKTVHKPDELLSNIETSLPTGKENILSKEQQEYIVLITPLLHILKSTAKLLSWTLSEDNTLVELCCDRLYKPVVELVEPLGLAWNYEYYILSNLRNKKMRVMRNHDSHVLDIVENIVKESFLAKEKPVLTCSKMESDFKRISLIGYLLFAYSGVSFQFMKYFDVSLHHFSSIYSKNTQLVKDKFFVFCSPSPLLHSFASYYDECGGLFGLWEEETSFLLHCLNCNKNVPETTTFAIRRQYDLHKETFSIMGNDTVFEVTYTLYKYIVQAKSRIVERDGMLLSFAIDAFMSLFCEFEEGMEFVCEERSCEGILESFRELAKMLVEKQ